jgi:hypothetical protein
MYLKATIGFIFLFCTFKNSVAQNYYMSYDLSIIIAETTRITYTHYMPQVNCKQCSTEFYAKPSWLKNGYGKFCSVQCRQQGQKNGKKFKCHMCLKEIYRTSSGQQRSKSGKFFCNKSCQTLWRNSEVHIGANHPNWTTGQSSYRDRLRRSSEEQVCKRCNTDDIRILSVHHKDRNRDNNKLSNLIFMCHNCHYLVHKFSEESEGYITA